MTRFKAIDAVDPDPIVNLGLVFSADEQSAILYAIGADSRQYTLLTLDAHGIKLHKYIPRKLGIATTIDDRVCVVPPED